MWHNVALIRYNVSEDRINSIVMVERISEFRYSLLADYFHPDDGGGMFLQNVDSY
jgi:hypothetical protein